MRQTEGNWIKFLLLLKINPNDQNDALDVVSFNFTQIVVVGKCLKCKPMRKTIKCFPKNMLFNFFLYMLDNLEEIGSILFLISQRYPTNTSGPHPLLLCQIGLSELKYL